MSSALLNEKYSKLKKEIDEKNKFEQVLKSKNSDSNLTSNGSLFFSSKFSLNSLEKSSNSFSEELVEMIKKHNIILNEKKILKSLIFKLKNELFKIDSKYKSESKIVIELQKENKNLKLKINELNTNN